MKNVLSIYKYIVIWYGKHMRAWVELESFYTAH